MTEPATTGPSRSSDWTLMHVQHDAFRRDLDGLLARMPAAQASGPAGPCSAASCAFITPPRTRPCGRRCAPSSPVTPPSWP